MTHRSSAVPIAIVLSTFFLTIPYAPASERKSVTELPAVKELPNPFVFNDGSPVREKGDWDRRREEIKKLIEYQYGEMPPASAVSVSKKAWAPTDKAKEVEDKRGEDPAALPAGAVQTQYVLRTADDIDVPLLITVPPGKGPFPAIIRGDLCWGRVAPSIAAEVARRGYLLAEFDRNAIVPDENSGRNVGLYAKHPTLDFGALAAWAWGFHRVTDYLLTRDDVQHDHIAVTGHSRGGKAVLLAGATDERIALTVPNNSGCGGAGCYRRQGEKSETIEIITKRFPYWFQPEFGQFVGNIDRLPMDQHFVKALVAPRALLTNEALGDLWANPSGTQHTHLAAREVYKFVGAEDKIGIAFREGKHEHNLDDWKTLLDFADWQFRSTKPPRRFDALAFPGEDAAFSWAAPEPIK